MRLAPSSAVSHAVEAASGAAGRALAAFGVAPILPSFPHLLGCVWVISYPLAQDLRNRGLLAAPLNVEIAALR